MFDVNPRYSTDELEGSFKPEFVCLQESCNATEVRLLDVGIENIEISKLELWLTRLVSILGTYVKRCNSLARFVRASTSAEDRLKLLQLSAIINTRTDIIRGKVNRARYIWSRLVNAAWNTTEAFVDSLGAGRMELDNKWADPSGCGEGFSYIK